MLRNLLLGLGASALVGMIGAGCASQNGSSAELMNSTEGNGQAAALVNQGRFPAPMYSQDQEPNYALTGQERQSWAWAPVSGYFQVGNARILVPPTE